MIDSYLQMPGMSLGQDKPGGRGEPPDQMERQDFQPRFVIGGGRPLPPPVPARRCPPVPSTQAPPPVPTRRCPPFPSTRALPSVSPRGGAVKRASPGGSDSPSKRGATAEVQKKASRRNLFGDPPATMPPTGASTRPRNQSGAPHTYAAAAQSRYLMN